MDSFSSQIMPTAPDVKDIKGLINLANRQIEYKNLNCKCLWGILPELYRLDKMVGMKRLKQTVFHQIIYYLQDLWSKKGKFRTSEDGEYLHTVITGPPGCGKTSVAEIIGKIYQGIGILSEEGSFTIAKREDFVAPYLGQTAIKTRLLLESCIGGVLFIDEAYSLGSGQQDKDSFSKEAIDTLNAFLSEHKKDFCCIIAGYEDEIERCFFRVNAGLERRFPWVHRIDEYDPAELVQIFMKKVYEIGWDLNINKSLLEKLITDNRKTTFKNHAGDIETFVSKCKMAHAKRVFSLDDRHKRVLTDEDLNYALEIAKENSFVTQEENNIPPFLYT